MILKYSYNMQIICRFLLQSFRQFAGVKRQNGHAVTIGLIGQFVFPKFLGLVDTKNLR